MPQPFLVLGGTGQTGHHITQKLMQHGHAVRVLARNVSAAQEHLGSQVEIVAGDITRFS